MRQNIVTAVGTHLTWLAEANTGPWRRSASLCHEFKSCQWPHRTPIFIDHPSLPMGSAPEKLP